VEINLFLHPAALLVMLVATAFPQIWPCRRGALTNGSSSGAGAGPDTAVYTKSRVAVVVSGTSTVAASVTLDATQETLLLSAINAAIVASVPQHTMSAEASPAPPIWSDASDHQQASLASDMVADRAARFAVGGIERHEPDTLPTVHLRGTC